MGAVHLPDFLTLYASSQPGKLAVIDDRPGGSVVSWTYARLETEANRLANALASLGVGQGEKVIWCGPNSPQVVAVINATRKLGAVAVPLNYRLTTAEARYIVTHSDASAAYVDAEYAHLIPVPRDEDASHLRHVLVYGGAAPAGMLGDDHVARAPAEPPAGQAGGTNATMIYTSGTTGKPKGAYRKMTDQSTAVALIGLIGYTPDDIYLTSGPLYHSGPLAFMGAGLTLGQTVIVQRKFEPEDWLRLVDKYQASSTFSAPPLIRLVCALPTEVKARYDRSSMRIMLANAAPWSFALKQAYLADFPPDSLWEVYGSTELGVNCVLEPRDQLRKPGSCGRPAPGVEIRLLDAGGDEVTGTGPAHPGELYVRSTAVFNEYYKQPESYRAAMPTPASTWPGTSAPARCPSWTNSRAQARASCSSASSGPRTGPVMPGRSANPSAPRVRMPEGSPDVPGVPGRCQPSATRSATAVRRGPRRPAAVARAAARVCAVAGSTTSR